MSRTPETTAAHSQRPSHGVRRSLTVCMLFIIASFLALTGCSNLGEFDQDAVAQQAESYYESKYGAHAEVTDVWEDRSYQLFGYRSSGRAFCTMDDGNTVLVDFEEGVLGDNRQQDDIVAAYEAQLRDAIQDATQGLERAGYTVSLVFINNLSPEADGFLEGQISTYTWQKNDDSPEESGSFFYARYAGSDRFFKQEASRVSLGAPSIDLEISGEDANYEHGFPTSVPAQPTWVDPIDEACDCPVCRQGFSRAYLHHLVRQKEMLAGILISQHNIHYLLDLMRRAREAVLAGTYAAFLADWMASPAARDW